MTERTAGAIAGAAATLPMTAFMVAAHKILPDHEQYPLPPREITMRASEAVGTEEITNKSGRRTPSTLAAHFGFGTAAGMLYPSIAGRTGLPRVAEGVLFGIGVWAVNYLGLMPGLGLSRHAVDDPPERIGLMVGAHVIWGAATAGLYSRLAD